MAAFSDNHAFSWCMHLDGAATARLFCFHLFCIPAPAPENALIRLRDLQKKFVTADGKHFDAVRSVSLDIGQGTVFGLIGKSGAGKSTLLRLINLLERPDSGEVVVAGQRLTDLGRRALREARQNIGMIFQQFNLLQNASVFENVAFPLRIHGGHSRAQIEQRVRECLDIVGLADKAGAFGIKHLDGIKNIDGVEVVSLVGRELAKTQEVADKYGIQHVTTELADSLALSEVDAVILCTPTQMHAAQAIECLKAGSGPTKYPQRSH